MDADILENPNFASPGDRLSVTLFFASALHAILILGVVFEDNESTTTAPPSSLEVILVQEHHQKSPQKADYLAQSSQEGGGTKDKPARPSRPFTALEPDQQQGIASQAMVAGSPNNKTITTPQVLNTVHSQNRLKNDKPQPNPHTEVNPNHLAELNLRISKMAAELNQARTEYAKRPKKLQLTASTQEYAAAPYMVRWVDKIERIGNLNLPNEAQVKRLSGKLVLEVELKHDGSLVEVNLISSSGEPILDNAAKQIVSLATPFEAFPPKLRKLADHIEIVRTWEFSQTGLVTH